MVTGADKKNYIFRIPQMIQYLEATFGVPEKIVKNPTEEDFQGMKGIIVIRGHGWSNAGGHVTLWDGRMCVDACHFMGALSNGKFIPETGQIWVLR